MKGSDMACKEDFGGPRRTQERKLRTKAFCLLTTALMGDHALRLAGATKPSGKPFPREWARQLLVAQRGEKEGIEDPGSKAIEVNAWLKGKKLPSIRNIEQSWNVVATLHASRIPDEAAGRDVWIFSWMIALLMEKHYEEIRCAFKRDKVKFQRRQIQRYYRRFFHHLKTVLPA
jgi:hypothetical protein